MNIYQLCNYYEDCVERCLSKLLRPCIHMMYYTLRIFYYAELETEDKQKQMHIIIYVFFDKNFNTTSFMILMCCFCYIYGKT